MYFLCVGKHWKTLIFALQYQHISQKSKLTFEQLQFCNSAQLG